MLNIRQVALCAAMGLAVSGFALAPVAYAGMEKTLGAGVLAVLTGIAIWKPVQFGWLTFLFGDFDAARLIHFAAMTAIVLFLAVHIPMALLVPKSLRAMIRGR
jgi:thiosulfate reductase cytochrome b subunit